VRFDPRQCGLNVPQLPLHGEREGWHRALHSLQHVHAQQVDQALLSVYLAEETLSTSDLRAVLPIVGILLVWEHVAEWRVGGQVQPPNFEVYLSDRRELACSIDVRFNVSSQ
jgi:hypothetical protein